MLHRDPSGRFVPLVAATVVGGLIGAGVAYGGQVYQNYQAGRQGWDAWQPTDGGAIARSAASGALASGASFFVGPAVAGLPWLARFGSPLVRSILAGGIEGITSNTLAQLAMNLALGCDWARGLDSAAFSGLVSGGVGGGIGYSGRRAIRLVGFRGVGISNTAFEMEPGLIKAGHVGISFDGKTIYGFHPSPQAIAMMEELHATGNAPSVFAFLKEGGALRGQVQDDTAVFLRASALAQGGARTRVSQEVMYVPPSHFKYIARTIKQQMAEGTPYPAWYRFPSTGEAMPTQCNNCATWPRTIGLPLPEYSGQLSTYIKLLEERGIPWP